MKTSGSKHYSHTSVLGKTQQCRINCAGRAAGLPAPCQYCQKNLSRNTANSNSAFSRYTDAKATALTSAKQKNYWGTFELAIFDSKELNLYLALQVVQQQFGDPVCGFGILSTLTPGQSTQCWNWYCGCCEHSFSLLGSLSSQNYNLYQRYDCLPRQEYHKKTWLWKRDII